MKYTSNCLTGAFTSQKNIHTIFISHGGMDMAMSKIFRLTHQANDD